MNNSRMKLGKMGEELACSFLVEKGYAIIERNWRCGHYEIDIVSLNKDGLHFVEVKSRVAPVSANPEENVGYRKQMKIAKAAQLYLRSVRKKEISSDIEVFFDVISVIFEGEKTSISFFPEAYVPIYT